MKDLEIPAPPTSSGRNLDRDKFRLRRDYRGKPNLEDLPEEGSMTSRSSSLGVSKLRDRYSSERPASFDSPRYSSSRTTSSKSVGALQSRFADKTDSSPTTRLSSSGTQQRSSSIDLSHSSKPKNVVEEKKRYGTPEKRLSSESGYGSLERDKSKDLTSQKGKSRNGKNGSIGKISENGSLPADPDFEIASTVMKTLAQRSGSESDSSESRKTRMEMYKEKRRRELAEKHGGSASIGLQDAPSKSRKLPKEPSAVPSLLQKKNEVSSVSETTQKEEQQAKKNRRSFTDTVKVEDTLQARLRRSETEDGSNTYKILARHRERQSSVSSDVFSPKEKDTDPSDKLLDDEGKEKQEPEEESQPAVSSKVKDEDGKSSSSSSSRKVSLSSQGTVEDESKDSTASRSQSTKQSKDRRRRQNVTITAEDVKEARRMGTQMQTESSSKPHSEPKSRKAPFKWEAKVETTRRPSLENVSTDSEVSRSSPVSRRKVLASPAKVETVTIAKPKTSSPKSERYKLNNSSSAERKKFLPKQASLSSTEDDSSSSAFEIRRQTKPRSGSASSATEGSPKRKARVLPHTPVGETVSKVSQSESSKVNKAGGFKPSENTRAMHHGDELSKNKKDDKKIPSSPLKTSSPSRKLPSVPQDKSLTTKTQIIEPTKSRMSEREERKSIEIEEEVISSQVIVKEKESREIQAKSELTKKRESLEKHTDETEKKKEEIEGSEVDLKRDAEEESLLQGGKNREDTSKDEKKTEVFTDKSQECFKGDGESKIEKKEEKKLESAVQRKSKTSKTLQEKRLRSRTTEIPMNQTESPPASPSVKRVQWRDRQGSFDSSLPGEDVKRQALETKDDELFEMMKLRAKLIKEHEMEERAEKGVEIDDSTEDEEKSVKEIPPQDVIKVSVTDRMSAFKQGNSAPLPKMLIPKTILKKPTTSDVKPVASSEREQKAASGEIGSDKNEEEEKEAESPDQLASLSLSDKMKLFASLSQQAQDSVPSPKIRQRHPRQRSDDRSKTQPVTPEELHDIARNAREREEEERIKVAGETKRVMEVVTEEPEVEAKEDELTKMSLAEKMKLFHEKAKCADAPPPPKINRQKRKRRTGSRYTTQPITLDEVKKASGPSPLLLSFGKTVDPEVASGLSIADQVALVYQPEDVATAKSAEMVPPLAVQPQKKTKPEAEDDKMGSKMQEKLTLNLDSPQKTESPPSPSFPKSDAVDKSIKRARSLDQKELEKIRPDQDSPVKKHTTQKEIRAAAEKSRNEKLADVSSSESEVDSRMVSTMDQRPDKTIIKRHARQLGFGTRESERYKTQPAVSPSLEKPDSLILADKRKKVLHPSKSFDLERRKTQPVTPDEMAEVKHMGPSTAYKTTSISERLSSLKQSGENDWRKRIEKDDDTPKSSRKSDHGSDSDKTTSSSLISQRLKLIEAQGDSWKNRVEEKDVTQFTVEGKCKIQGKDLAPTKGSPTPFRRVGSTRKAPDNLRVSLIEDSGSESSGTTSNKAPAISTSDTTSVTTTTESEDSEPDFQIVKRKVAIPKADNETFSKFYQSSHSEFLPEDQLSAISEQKQERFEISVSDFDALTEDATKSKRLTGLNRNDHRRSLRPQRRERPSNNPLRALKTRSDILSEYTEEKMVLTEVETKPKKKEKKDFSNKSLAAMTSKIALVEEKEKLHSPKPLKDIEGNMSQLLPYKDLMLIHIKGRKFVQVRLVEPKVSSLNSGDCFICVTPTNVFLWIGQYANVIEKSKASEVAQHIQSKKDLGCKASSVTTIEETKLKNNGSQRNWKKMVEALGGSCDDAYGEVGASDEDQIHEIYVIDTNMVYRLEGSTLEPYGDYWATLLKFEMLKTDEILVFDFGSELYIWQGKKSLPKQRKKAIQLARILYERGYDYSEYDVNPIYPQQTDAVKQSEGRPDWVLLAKTSEHMETVLFQSKFVDWPNESRLIKMKSSEKEQKESLPEIVPFDAKLMIQPTNELPNVIFEGTNVGRGTGLDVVPCNNNYNPEYFDKVMRRGNKITTLSVLVWHVLEYTHSIVPKECFGQLHEGDTYVVRWQYRIEAAGARSLKGEASKWGHAGGRERCAYFFWQGSKSTINEKGASALMTVELDSERGPQRQVIQGKEPAVFLHLFQGRMMVHIGKREEEETNSQGSYRLYYIKGEIETEACLVEVPCRMKMLRSRTSFVLLNLEDVEKNKASIHIWHGVKSSEASRNTARFAAERLKEFVPMEAGMKLGCEATIEEIEEGKETEFFFKAVGNDRSSYDSAIDDDFKYDFTLRLFHLTSSTGAFIANEVLNASRTEQHFTPYPCLQSDMYTAPQPALFVIDNHYEVYLWQGWLPEEKSSEETPKVTGSFKMKWNLERKCAMETVLAYCKEKNSKKPPEAFLIHAGLEPQTFINLFPTWEMREDVAHINKKAGRRGDRAIRVRDVLQQLKRTRYTLAELKEKPEGVDPLKLETYLSDEEFKKVLTVTRGEFEKLQSWKKTELKKNAGLF